MAVKTSEKQVVELPDQVGKLRAEVAQKDRRLKEQEQIIGQHKKQIAEYEKLLKLFEEAERLSKLKRFASSSEKSTFQIDFFDEAELEQAFSDLEKQIPDEHKPKKKTRKKREGFSPELPRMRVELTLTDEEKEGAINTFFTKVKEELDIIPAQAQVIEYWQIGRASCRERV